MWDLLIWKKRDHYLLINAEITCRLLGGIISLQLWLQSVFLIADCKATLWSQAKLEVGKRLTGGPRLVLKYGKRGDWSVLVTLWNKCIVVFFFFFFKCFNKFSYFMINRLIIVSVGIVGPDYKA